MSASRLSPRARRVARFDNRSASDHCPRATPGAVGGSELEQRSDPEGGAIHRGLDEEGRFEASLRFIEVAHESAERANVVVDGSEPGADRANADDTCRGFDKQFAEQLGVARVVGDGASSRKKSQYREPLGVATVVLVPTSDLLIEQDAGEAEVCGRRCSERETGFESWHTDVVALHGGHEFEMDGSRRPGRLRRLGRDHKGHDRSDEGNAQQGSGATGSTDSTDSATGCFHRSVLLDLGYPLIVRETHPNHH